MTWDTITLTPFWGADVITCIREAKAISCVIFQTIYFKFNGYMFTITPSSDEQMEYVKYREWMRK